MERRGYWSPWEAIAAEALAWQTSASLPNLPKAGAAEMGTYETAYPGWRRRPWCNGTDHITQIEVVI